MNPLPDHELAAMRAALPEPCGCSTCNAIQKLLTELTRLREENERLIELLRYVAFNRLPLGNTVFETLPEHYQAKVHDAMREEGTDLSAQLQSALSLESALSKAEEALRKSNDALSEVSDFDVENRFGWAQQRNEKALTAIAIAKQQPPAESEGKKHG